MFRASRAPQSLGSCAADLPRLAGLVNEATEMLLKAGGESGWWGSWQKIRFNVDPDDPYVTLPRWVARLINMTVCKRAIRIQNEFYEMMEFGVGIQPQNSVCRGHCPYLETYDRGTFPLMRDLDTTGNPKILRIFPTDQRDFDVKRVLIQGVDSNGAVLRSLDNGVDVQGVYIRLRPPFVDTEFSFSEASGNNPITGIQKDITVGDVRIHEVDTVTGDSVSLTVLEPGEQVANYRRYFINGLPSECCRGGGTVQVEAMAKMEYVPISVDQDWLLIANIPALKRACESVRYSEIDNPQAQVMAKTKMMEAIKLLNQELVHYVGRTVPAINFSPFGHDTLARNGIGTLV